MRNFFLAIALVWLALGLLNSFIAKNEQRAQYCYIMTMLVFIMAKE